MTVQLKAPRPPVRTWIVVLWAVPSVLFLAFAALRLLGVTGNQYVIALVALTPYLGVVGLALGAAGLLMRRWIFGGVVLAFAMITSATVVPRMVAHEQPRVFGPRITVMTANLYVGRADAVAVLDLVRQHNVDVLSMQELSPAMVQDLERAGIDRVLPYRLFEPQRGAAGSGLASKYPLQPVQIADPATFAQPSAVVDLPGVVDPEVLVVHSAPGVEQPGAWKAELAELPGTTTKSRPRVLLGDFNATLDHPDLRDVLSRGYVDVAERHGSGLTPTWPSGIWPPPVTIDHILVDALCAVVDYQVFDLPGSDHRAAVATIDLP